MRTDIKRLLTHGRSPLATAIVISLMLVSPTTRSQELEAGAGVTESNPSAHRIDLEFGYFTSRRENFRQIYGSYFDYGLSFQHRLNERWSWEIRTEFIRLRKEDAPIKYWSLSATPALVYRPFGGSTLVPVVGAGVGLTMRTVVSDMWRWDGQITVTQRELSAALVALTGIDWRFSRAFILGGRFYFDYHPFGDPSTGDFGDTGGYHFTLRLGRVL